MSALLTAVAMRRSAVFAASLLGLACWIAAMVDVRSQQESERPGLRPMIGGQAPAPEIHHMRGWLPHRSSAAGPAQHAYPGEHTLG